MGFVPRDLLGFDLASLIEDAIERWSSIQGTEVIQAPAESFGDFIAEQMDARDLRLADDHSDDALFNADASEAQFRQAVAAGLDDWLLATIRPRTPEEIDEYNRRCGE